MPHLSLIGEFVVAKFLGADVWLEYWGVMVLDYICLELKNCEIVVGQSASVQNLPGFNLSNHRELECEFGLRIKFKVGKQVKFSF